MSRKLRVLAVGSAKGTDLVEAAMLPRDRSSLSIARDCRELISIQPDDRFAVIVLEVSTTDPELKWKAEHIRRKWPDSQVLLIGISTHCLEDPLYDDRVHPDVEPAKLLAAIERLRARKRWVEQAKEMQSRQAECDSANVSGVIGFRNL